tara:strand:+ start:658 stop:3603 length:2946 start_codon:yes stop_codon:yes gene_type:complete
MNEGTTKPGMRATTGVPRVGLMATLFVLTLASVLPGIGAAQEGPAELQPLVQEDALLPQQDADDEAIRLAHQSMLRVHETLEGRTGAAFETEVAALLISDPIPCRDALLLRAGTPVPSTLPAARAQRRAIMRQEAIDVLLADLDSPVGMTVWPHHLEDIILEARVHIDLRCAALRVVASLRIYWAIETVSRSLDALDPREHDAARDALHGMMGRWFESTAEWTSFNARTTKGMTLPVLQAELSMQEARMYVLLGDLLEYAPARAIQYLDPPDPDSTIRIMAATHLGAAVGSGKLDAERAIAIVLAQLERERDAAAFTAESSALVNLLQGRPADDPKVESARATLRGACALPHLVGPALSAWRRVPWAKDLTEGSEARATALTFATEWVLAISGDDGRIVDSDEFAIALEDWRALAENVVSTPEVARSRKVIGQLVSGLMARAETTEALGRAAAGALGAVVAGANLDLIVGPLEQPDTPAEVRLVLLAALRDSLSQLAPEAGPETPAGRAADLVIQMIGDEDARLQNAALDLVLSDAATPFLRLRMQNDGAGLHAYIMDVLANEVDTGVQSSLLELLRRVGHAGTQDSIGLLLAHTSLRKPTAERVRELRSTLTVLVNGDRVAALAGAAWLLGSNEGETPETREVLEPNRLAAALRLVTDSVAQVTVPMPAAGHDQVLQWAEDLTMLVGAASVEEPVRRSVLDEHLEAARAEDPTKYAYLEALFRGEDAQTDEQIQHVQDAFDVAMSRNTAARTDKGEYHSPAQIQRDRARFLERAGRGDQAALVWQRLLESLPADSSLLKPRDRRQAARRLRALKGPANYTKAAKLLEVLVTRESWRDVGAEQRLADLEGWVEAVLACDDPATLGRVFEALNEVPPEREETAYVTEGPTPTDAPWKGLDGVRSDHLRLLDLIERITLERDRREAESTVQPEAPDPVVDLSDGDVEDVENGEGDPIPEPADGGGEPAPPGGTPSPGDDDGSR